MVNKHKWLPFTSPWPILWGCLHTNRQVDQRGSSSSNSGEMESFLPQPLGLHEYFTCCLYQLPVDNPPRPCQVLSGLHACWSSDREQAEGIPASSQWFDWITLKFLPVFQIFDPIIFTCIAFNQHLKSTAFCWSLQPPHLDPFSTWLIHSSHSGLLSVPSLCCFCLPTCPFCFLGPSSHHQPFVYPYLAFRSPHFFF